MRGSCLSDATNAKTSELTFHFRLNSYANQVCKTVLVPSTTLLYLARLNIPQYTMRLIDLLHVIEKTCLPLSNPSQNAR